MKSLKISPVEAAASQTTRGLRRSQEKHPRLNGDDEPWMEHRTFQPRPSLDALVPFTNSPAETKPWLTVNSANDRYEHEADRAAQQAMAAAGSRPSLAPFSRLPEKFGAIAAAYTGGEDARFNSAEQVLIQSGKRLDPAIRREMEQRFGHDFSHIRIHNDAQAEESARELQADAYAAGSHIVFASRQFEPWNRRGSRLLAHELAHTIQQGETPITIQRQPAGKQTSDAPANGKSAQSPAPTSTKIPDWALSSPLNPLQGVVVPGYESGKENYTESDRVKMLQALSDRVQLNGQRLADFYDNLRDAWIDLVIDLDVPDSGSGLAGDIILSILESSVTALMPPLASALTGSVAGTVIDVVNSTSSERATDRKKKELKQMMTAPSVRDVGASDARGQLAGLLLDAVSYSAWVMSASLLDLGKFRIPPEFPDVPPARIRFQIAAAVLRYNSPALSKHALADTADTTGTFVAGNDGSPHFKLLADGGVLQIHIAQGAESDIHWRLAVSYPIMKSIAGHTVKELKGPNNDQIPVVVEFTAPLPRDPKTSRELFPPDVDSFPRVVFGRNTAGTLVFQEANFMGLYALSRYCHPDEKPLTDEDVMGKYINGSYQSDPKATTNLRHHFRASADCAMHVLFEKFIDPFVLRQPEETSPGKKSAAPETKSHP